MEKFFGSVFERLSCSSPHLPFTQRTRIFSTSISFAYRTTFLSWNVVRSAPTTWQLSRVHLSTVSGDFVVFFAYEFNKFRDAAAVRFYRFFLGKSPAGRPLCWFTFDTYTITGTAFRSERRPNHVARSTRTILGDDGNNSLRVCVRKTRFIVKRRSTTEISLLICTRACIFMYGQFRKRRARVCTRIVRIVIRGTPGRPAYVILKRDKQLLLSDYCYVVYLRKRRLRSLIESATSIYFFVWK